jgi:hypothetical protein
MIKVVFPEPEFRMKQEGGRQYIFDSLRKSWIILTSEEWVRQNFLSFLQKELHYPSSLMAVEREIVLNGLKKRFDILVYNEHHQPWMLVECKAPEIMLNEKVLSQVLLYNQSVPVSYLVITNGKTTIAWQKRDDALKLLSDLPQWKPQL